MGNNDYNDFAQETAMECKLMNSILKFKVLVS